MNVNIKRVDPTLPMPEYKTSGAAAFDMYAREETVVPAKGWKLVPSNFIIDIPEEYCLIVSARSSLAKHHPGLFKANGFGLIDSDFNGPTDEILISLYNFSENDITIKRGERIAQGRFTRFMQPTWQEVAEMTAPDRGGIGSTGK